MFKLFKNSKAARKHLPHILLNLQAVDRQLKPCYLWDSFTADVDEIQHFLNELKSSGKINLELCAFAVNDTYFVTQKEFLNSYLDIFTIEKVSVVDVSGSEEAPSVLYDDEKRKALKPILNSVTTLTKKLMDSYDVCDRTLKVDFSICNITTLYGALLGYPTLYWYKSQKADINFTCLSMVPLTVYRVANCKENLNHNYKSSHSMEMNNKLYDKEIFTFSTPQNLVQEIGCVVKHWFTELEAKCKNSMFNDLSLSWNTVTLPYISM